MKTNQYIIVQSIEGAGIVATTGAIENLLPAAEVRGFAPNGTIKEQSAGRITLREEIVGQPEFDGLCGPMYGGPGIVRYEDWKTYDRLSA